MRTIVYLILFLCIFWFIVYAEAYRKTAMDMSMESYTAPMRKQAGYSAAEIRADDYRTRYERCDEHHNSTNLTALSKSEPVKKQPQAKAESGSVKPFFQVPVWQ